MSGIIDLAFIIYGWSIVLYSCPHRLEVPVEEERIESTWWRGGFDEVREFGFVAGLGGEGYRSLVVSIGCSCVAEEERHCL